MSEADTPPILERGTCIGGPHNVTTDDSCIYCEAVRLHEEVERLREALERIDVGLTDYVENGADCTMDPQDVLDIVRHVLRSETGNR